MTFNRLERTSLYAIIVVSPLLLGSNRPLFWILNSLLASLCLIGFAVSEWNQRNRSRVTWRVPVLVISVLGVSLVWMALQAMPEMPLWARHPVWGGASAILPISGSISLAPRLTLTAIAWAAPLSIFVSAFRRGTSLRDVDFVLQLMLGMICLVMAFGVTAEAMDLDTVGLSRKAYYQGWLTGTFVNRNTAAAFFAVGLCVALALMVDWKGGAGSQRNHSWFGSRKALFALVAALLWSGVLLSGSRGGAIAAASGATAILVVGLLPGSAPGRRKVRWIVPILALALVVGLVAMLRRSNDAVDSNSTRLSLYREALEAIAQRPLLGHGSGTYEIVQPLYHAADTPSHFVWNHAHSGVLELAAGNGVPAALLVVCTYLGLVLYLGWAASQRGSPRCAILAGFGAMIAAGVHAIIDFSLQTQSVALYVAIVAGLGAGQSASGHLYRGRTVSKALS